MTAPRQAPSAHERPQPPKTHEKTLPDDACRDRTRRWWSGGLAALCLAAAVGLLLHRSAKPQLGFYSLSQIAAVLAAASFGVFLLAVLRHPRIAEQLVAWFDVVRRHKPATLAPIRVAAASIAAVGAAVLCHWHIAAAIGADAGNDERDYLRVAHASVAAFGRAGLWRGLLDGSFTEANRHPLYLWFLTLADADLSSGRWVSRSFGVAFLSTVAGLSWRRYGAAAAVAALLLGSIDRSLHESAGLVACETLLATLTLSAWYVLSSRPADADAAAPTAGVGRPTPRRVPWFVGGLLLGLAYETKASALLLAAATVAVLLARERGRRAWPAAAIFAAGLAAAAWPLWWRNVVVYGTPFHSFNNRLLFLDRFEDWRMVGDAGLSGNLARYASTHSAADVLRRLGDGLLWQGFILLRMVGPAPFDSGRAVIGLIVWGLAAIGAAAPETAPFARRLLAAWLAVFVPFFAWYAPIAVSDRFLLPLLGPVLMLAGAGAAKASSFATAPRSAKDALP